MKIILTSITLITINAINIGAQNEYFESCQMNENVPDDLCILSISGFEVSYYPVNSLKMFYLDYRNCNSWINKTIFRERPYFTMKFLNPDDLFTIMMVDGKNYPIGDEKVYLNYLASNIQGSDLGIAEIGGAIELASYTPPFVHDSSRNNTISFLLYRQTNELELHLLDVTLLSRENFIPIAWASKQRTVQFCGPIVALQMNVY